MEKAHVTLTDAQVAHLTGLTTRGTVAVRTFRRATALLALAQGQSYSAVARQVKVTYTTVSAWANAFAASG